MTSFNLPRNFAPYALEPGQFLPAAPAGRQRAASCPRPTSAFTMLCASLLSGIRPDWYGADATVEAVHADLEWRAKVLKIPLARVFAWARSISIPPDDTLPYSTISEVIPTRILDKTAHPYQVKYAAWAAARRGCVLAFDVGVGKTLTSVMAAIGAVRLGACSDAQICILHPVNAAGAWLEYIPVLREHFKLVIRYSSDSVHHISNLERGLGGALIVDEAHKFKNFDTGLTEEAELLRSAFDWGVALTGSLFHTGIAGATGVQDLACPGLSRVLDPFVLGRMLDCVIEKTFTRPDGQAGRSLTMGIPAESRWPEFTHYLRPGVVSLLRSSPEVAQVVHVPPQCEFLIETWPKPPDVTLWLPDLPLDTYLGTLAVAVQHEREEILAKNLGLSVEEAIKVTLERMKAGSEIARQNAKDYIGIPGLPRLLAEAVVDGRLNRIIVDGRFVQRDGPGPKLAWVGEWLDANPTEQLVLAAKTTVAIQLAKQLCAARGIEFGCITGHTPQNIRPSIVNDFQSGKHRVIILQQRSGSVSINLTAAATSILIDHDADPLIYSQFKGRVARQGQRRESTHYDLAFGPYQRQRILALQRGEKFDVSIRRMVQSGQLTIANLSDA